MYGSRFITQVTIPVWLILKALVMSAIPDGGAVLSNGYRRVGSSVDAFIVADPFCSIYTDIEGSCVPVIRFDIVEFIVEFI